MSEDNVLSSAVAAEFTISAVLYIITKKCIASLRGIGCWVGNNKEGPHSVIAVAVVSTSGAEWATSVVGTTDTIVYGAAHVVRAASVESIFQHAVAS